MISKQIRQKFISFFIKKKHKQISSSSLISSDSTVLLTTAGVQQLKPYLVGEKDPERDFGIRRLISIQKCFRTSDIDEVGDKSHLTFFEMLGNFSIGDYFKEEAIEYAWEFLTKEMKIDEKRLWVTIFSGDDKIPHDDESYKIWQKFVSKDKINEFPRSENWWGPPGKTGPCGPCSEIHFDVTGKPCKLGKKCIPNCKCGRFIELWNLVFTEYFMDEKGNLSSLPSENIDTGMGLERLAWVSQKKSSIFETDLFEPIIKEIPGDSIKAKRIIADHLRGAVFLAADGVTPSNIEQGYILRRVLRKTIREEKILNLPKDFLVLLVKKIIELYKNVYPEVKSKENEILTVIQNEKKKFERALTAGIRETNSVLTRGDISGEVAFHLYETSGIPLEFIEEMAEKKGVKIDKKQLEEDFKEASKKHQKISKAGAEKKFGGGAAEAGEIGKKLHTATHLLHQALRDVLGKHVRQMGSDINQERLRFDFSHPEKLSEAQKKKVEDIINEKIKENLTVTTEEMLYEQATKSGALAFFKEKYPKIVKVYSIGNYSKEICAGPHVSHTGEIGHFKIKNEKSSSAGVRRIKATVE